MTILNLILYILLPIAGAVGLALYFLWSGAKTKKAGGVATDNQPTTTGVIAKSTTRPVLAFVYDSVIGTMGEQELSGEIVDGIRKLYRDLGRFWDEDGKKLPHINKYQIPDGTIHYRPVGAVMAETRENPPESLMDCFDHDAVPIVYNVTAPVNPWAKLAPILWFCGVTIFILFMWGSSAGK